MTLTPVQDDRVDLVCEKVRGLVFGELYEDVEGKVDSPLDPAVDSVLTAMGDPAACDTAWRTHGLLMQWMLDHAAPTVRNHAELLGLGVEPVVVEMDRWLKSKEHKPTHIDMEVISCFVYAPQALSEGIAVVLCASQVLDRNDVHKAMMCATDSILQGYAAFPGSAGRRKLLEEWLDAASAAYAKTRM